MKRNKEALENEWQRKTPNQERIQRGMMLTFPDQTRLMHKRTNLRKVMAEYTTSLGFSQVKYTSLLLVKARGDYFFVGEIDLLTSL